MYSLGCSPWTVSARFNQFRKPTNISGHTFLHNLLTQTGGHTHSHKLTESLAAFVYIQHSMLSYSLQYAVYSILYTFVCIQYLRLVRVLRILLRWRHRRTHHRGCRLTTIFSFTIAVTVTVTIINTITVTITITIINLHSAFAHLEGGWQCRASAELPGCCARQD